MLKYSCALSSQLVRSWPSRNLSRTSDSRAASYKFIKSFTIRTWFACAMPTSSRKVKNRLKTRLIGLKIKGRRKQAATKKHS